MAKDKDIDKKIRDSAEKMNFSAPADLWGKFSEKLSGSNTDINLDNKIKESIESLTGNVPPKIWTGINRQLNIDIVWKQICKELDKKEGYCLRRVSGIAALLVLLSGIAYFLHTREGVFLSNNFGNAYHVENSINKNITPETKESTEIYGSNKVEPIDNELRGNDRDINNPAGAFNIKSSRHIIEEETPVVYPAEDSLFPLQPLTFTFHTNMPERELINNYQIIIEDSANFPQRKSFGVGVTFSYNNTWIIDQDTKNSFGETSLTSTSKTYAAAYGLIMNYYFRNQNALTSELLINSGLRQEYGLYDEGRYYNKKTELNYYKIALQYQLSGAQRSGLISSRYSFKAGMYCGYLKNQFDYYNSVVVIENTIYKDIDYGIKLGLGSEQEWNNVVIAYGLNTEYGLMNIYKGTDKIPAGFNHTTPLSIGAYLNLMYKF